MSTEIFALLFTTVVWLQACPFTTVMLFSEHLYQCLKCGVEWGQKTAEHDPGSSDLYNPRSQLRYVCFSFVMIWLVVLPTNIVEVWTRVNLYVNIAAPQEHHSGVSKHHNQACVSFWSSQHQKREGNEGKEMKWVSCPRSKKSGYIGMWPRSLF